MCSNIPYTVNKTSSSLDVYRSLNSSHWRVLKYSGDTDFTVSTYGTRQWIDELDLPITQTWKQYFVRDQVGGYYEVMGSNSNFMFATIHGAGHQPAVTKPDVLY